MPTSSISRFGDTIATLRWDEALKTYEHWEFFYRASHLANLQIAVATDCSVVHAHVAGTGYRNLRGRAKFRAMGLRKHGFHSLRYPGGQIVRAKSSHLLHQDDPSAAVLRRAHP